MRKGIFGLALVAALAGCASVNTPMDDGYQFGDIGETRQKYCATADPESRARLLAAMRLAGATIPPSGICTGIEVTIPGVDVEQARKDQDRFSE